MSSTGLDSGKIWNRKLELSDNLSDFNCDQEDELDCNGFIHKEDEAKLFQKERQGITYLFFYENTMLGYVTLAMSSIESRRMEGKFKKHVSLKFYPSLLIGRLAVDNNLRKKGIGKYMCDWCVGLAVDMSEHVGCRYVILETSKGKKVEFYEKCGFQKGKELEDKKEKSVWMYQRIALE
jgi:GNAT superfamily N-acetyltransferase